MKALTVMVAFTGLCFLARPCHALSDPGCEGFIRSGDRTDLILCINYLDKQAGIVEQERGYELAGITMSNANLTKSVKDLHASVHEIEQKTERIKPYEVPDLRLLTDDLRDRAKELEKLVDAQGTLLVTQSQQIEDLRKQLDAMRAELAAEPRVHHVQPKVQHSAAPPKANPPAVKPTNPSRPQ